MSLVTGGCGFIGRHLVQTLINHGQPVRVLDISHCKEVFQGEIDFWSGSILDKDLLYNAMQGVSVVYHLAGIPHLWSKDPGDFYNLNVAGTKSVVEVAGGVGLQKFIYTSSETVLRGWRNSSNSPINESQPLPELNELPGPYSRSKLQAEQIVVQEIKRGLPGVIVYPTIPIGAGDINLTPPTQMIKNFLNGKTLAYMECNLNLIPVKAVAEGHILAAEKGTIGGRYILGQENFKMSQLLRLIEEHLDKPMPKRRVAYPMANIAARIMEFIARFSKKLPPASLEGVRLAGANMMFDSSKARRELALPQYSIPQALAETAQWLQENGHLE